MPTQLLLLVVAMAAIFYLLILRPQQRQKRQRAAMMDALRVGVEVLTVGGIYGTVRELRDDDFDIEIADGVVMKMDRRAIAAVVTETEPDEEPVAVEAGETETE
jgi:preprotein translocase subunit YajC